MSTGDHYHYPTTGTNGAYIGSYQVTTSPSTWITDNTIVSPAGYSKINIQGIDEVLNRLKNIEERMGLLERNLLLETRYKELKELGEKYKQLEKDLLEKEKIAEILKK